MRICIPMMLIYITFSFVALGVPASLRTLQKTNPYLKLFYPGGDRLEFDKSFFMAMLRGADDPTQVVAAFGVWLGGMRSLVRVGQLYRAKEALRDHLGDKVMERIDANFNALLAQEYKLAGRSNVARMIPFAELERQVAVLDLEDLTGDKFARVVFNHFISGSSGLPRAVVKFFSEAELTAEQLEVWQRLQLLAKQRKAARQ